MPFSPTRGCVVLVVGYGLLTPGNNYLQSGGGRGAVAEMDICRHVSYFTQMLRRKNKKKLYSLGCGECMRACLRVCVCESGDVFFSSYLSLADTVFAGHSFSPSHCNAIDLDLVALS